MVLSVTLGTGDSGESSFVLIVDCPGFGKSVTMGTSNSAGTSFILVVDCVVFGDLTLAK